MAKDPGNKVIFVSTGNPVGVALLKGDDVGETPADQLELAVKIPGAVFVVALLDVVSENT